MNPRPGDWIALAVIGASLGTLALSHGRRTASKVALAASFDERQLLVEVRSVEPFSLRSRLPDWERIEGRTARGAQLRLDDRAAVAAEAVASPKVVARRSLAVEVPHRFGVLDNQERVAWFDADSGRGVFPLAFAGLPSTDSVAYAPHAGVEVFEDLAVVGGGWLRIEGEPCVLTLAELTDSAEQASQLFRQGLELLRSWSVPLPPGPLLLVLLPKGEHEILTDFHLQERGIFVVSTGQSGLLHSTLFRDLARAACQRIAAERPGDEELVWSALAKPMAARLARACGLPGPMEGLDALARRYAVRPTEEFLADDPGDPWKRWRLENLVGPVFWKAMLEEWPGASDGLAELLPTLLEEGRSTSLRELDSLLGADIAAHVRSFLFTPRIQLDPQPESEILEATAARPRDPGRRTESLCLVYTGNNAGTLENCGCSVRQQGGLSRKVARIADVRAEQGELLLVDVGDALAGRHSAVQRSTSEQAAILTVLGESGYDALVPGASELSLDPAWLRREAARAGVPLIAANVLDRASGEPVFAPYRQVTRNGLAVAVIGLVELPYEREWYEGVERSILDQYRIEDALGAVERCLARMPPVDVCIVAGTIRPETASKLLAWSGRGADIVLSSTYRFARVARADERHVEVQTLLHKGMHRGRGYGYTDFERFGGGRVDVELASELWCTFSDLPIEASLPADPATVALLAELARELADRPETWIPSPLAGLAEESAPGARYAGSEACTGCHPAAARAWERTPHAHAFETLASKGKEWDPACQRCHTTGFLLSGGFRPDAEPAQRVRLQSVGCETCHGPGERHAAIHSEPASSRDADFELLMPARARCEACHDALNSPDFDFEHAVLEVCSSTDPSARKDPR